MTAPLAIAEPRSSASVPRLSALRGMRRPTGPVRAARPRDVFEAPPAPQMGVLLRGSTGGSVRELQKKLVSLGYLTSEAAATGPGVFGPRTEDAVRAFQKRHGLKTTGVVGAYTQAALNAAIARTSIANGPSVRTAAVADMRAASYASQYDGSSPGPGLNLFPLQPVKALLTSSNADRSSPRYSDVINQFAVGNNPRYARRGTQTWSHVFVQDVTHAMGAPVPRRMGGIDLNANGVCGWLRGMGPAEGWKPADAAMAQEYANAGCPVIAGWKNPEGPGHLAVVRPGALSDSGPSIAQAGSRSFNFGFIENGFGAVRPDFWVHK